MDILRRCLGLNSEADFHTAPPDALTEYAYESTRIRDEFEDVTLERFLDHVDHAVEVAGIDHVGLSGNFDGDGGVEGWDDAADTPNVTAALLERGYSEGDLAKVWGGNLLRVMRDVRAAATQRGSGRLPTISSLDRAIQAERQTPRHRAPLRRRARRAPRSLFRETSRNSRLPKCRFRRLA